MHEFWCDYVKPKYGEKTKLCYMDTNSFIVYIKTEQIYVDIAKKVETRFDSSYYGFIISLPKGENKKLIGLMTDELRGKIIIDFATLRPKTYSYLTDENDENQKSKNTKKCLS